MVGQAMRFFMICGLVAGLLLVPDPTAHASSTTLRNEIVPANFVTVGEEDGATVIRYRTGDEIDAAFALDEFATDPFQGYLLPITYIPLLVTDEVQAASSQTVNFDTLQTVSWRGVLEEAPAQIPPALGWEELEKAPVDHPAPQLPSAPVFTLRQGRVRGHTVRILAVSPIFLENGQTRQATEFRVSVPGTIPLKNGISELMAADTLQSTAIDGSRVAAQSDLGPQNVAATLPSAKVFVRQGGMQVLTGAQLATTALNLSDIDRLALFWRGQSVALEVRDTNGNGALEASESVRFFAPNHGDYWNRADVYWLLNRKAGATRMAKRSVAPSGAHDGRRTTAIEVGEWRNNSVRFSLYPGQDADHWYASRLRADATVHTRPALYPRVTAELALELPPTGGPATLIPTLNTVGRDNHTISVVSGGEAQSASLDTTTMPTWQQPWTPRLDFKSSGAEVDMILVPDDNITSLLVDSLAWTLPVHLNFKGRAASFRGVKGTWRYQLTNPPDNYWLYDISNPLQPIVLRGAGAVFQDGPEPVDYLLVDSTSFRTPDVVAHTPVSFGPGDGADAVYIAPAEFHAALAPLLAHRESQGYVVKVVDVQAIYDAWNYGYTAPEAIRAYLRYIVANGRPAPISALLVGDGSYDPMNYEGANNKTFIPPYLKTYVHDLRYVDPWLGQVGCENCFAQLDGEDPLDNPFEQPPGDAFFPDIYVGRLSVNAVDQLATVVAKIIDYEKATDDTAPWRSSSVWLADDYILPGSTKDNIRKDPAGDFAQSSEQVIELLPDRARPNRVYFGPPNPEPAPGDLPISPQWHEKNADRAHSRTVNLMSSGSGLVTAFTHSNHWQWAATASDSSTPYLFSVVDVSKLTNLDRLFISLSMTCYTSQFYRPSNFGTLDERLLIHPNGGAVGIWGPAGLSVAHGHDKLQIGFHNELWRAKPFSTTLGQLVAAGYYELFATTSCCQDVRRTFLILGDPLTKVRVRADQEYVYLPLAANQ